VIRRDQVPPGALADLFARLDDLHSRAGRPSTRAIAVRAGRGNVSASTVHNIFRSARLPNWTFLDHVITALGGADERDEFHALWETAWREAHSSAGQAGGMPHTRRVPGPPMAAPWTTAPGVGRDPPEPSLRQQQRILSDEIPAKNHYFTGRAPELDLIRRNFNSQQGPFVQVIAGMGGIGKTELAAEYVHRNFDKYEIIWWIRAEHHDRVRDALVKLAHRLEVRQAAVEGGRDQTIQTVLRSLQSETRASWLLVYDNAANPLDLQRYLPTGRPGGHIIITSRVLDLPGFLAADGLAIPPFTEQESVSYLRRRVPDLASSSRRIQLSPDEDAERVADATRLASELGHLPLAVDHAAAYLAETHLSVEEYLSRFARNAHLLLSEEPGDADLPGPVSGTWVMSTALLTPDAEHLFNLCAFFSPGPISSELVLQGSASTTDPPGLRDLLSEPRRVRAAASQLHRLSLAKVDGARDLMQMHRVVQAVTRGRLRHDRPTLFYAYRAAADVLLAESNPGNPDRSSSDAAYDLSLGHLESDHRFLHTDNEALRRLIIDQVRRLRLRGAHVEAMRFGQDALRIWRGRLGDDHIQVLTMAFEVAVAMYIDGRAADAHELIMRIRPRLRRYPDGDEFKVFLSCENFYAEDLRARSQFYEALELDMEILPKFEEAFGLDHERTLNVRNNIGIDYRQLGRFKDALEVDRSTLEDRRRILGKNDPITLESETAVARDLRSLGRYQESLDISRRVVNAFTAADKRENIHWLYACEGFAAALRKAGHHWDALRESEHVLQRYRDYLGNEHTFTLRAATNLINARRAVGDLVGAEELALETRDTLLRSSRPDDLLAAVLVNMASVLRATERPEEALSIDEQARYGFIRLYGDQHPLTLSASINYVADLATCRRLGDAIVAGYETVSKCHETLGADHPDTLMAEANLAIDLASAGRQEDADRRLADVLRRYEQTLTMEHPEARAAAQGIRLTAEIDAQVLAVYPRG
jgi:tetratricopeptide (TPR) repeat protein